MAETIGVHWPDVSGDTATFTAFIRNRAGTLLNSGGDVITETAGTGYWTFSLAETRAEATDYFVRIYRSASETAAYLEFDGILYAGQTVVDLEFSGPTLGVIFGTVGATSPTTTAFTPSSISIAGTDTNQWVNRIIVFLNNTTTAGLRGQATTISAATAAALPRFTYTALTQAPVSGDTFMIV